MPDPMPLPPEVTVTELNASLDRLFAPWVAELGLQVTHASPGEVQLILPITPRHVHGGGVVCGQTLMSAADTAMVLAVMTQLGGFKPMTTVQLNISFLRGVPGHSGQVRLTATVLRMGKSLVFGEVHMHSSDHKLAAHVTTTYALL